MLQLKKCNLCASHRCPFLIREVTDFRNGHIYVYEIGKHDHAGVYQRRRGLTNEQRILLKLHLTNGDLTPTAAMHILIEANDGIVDTAGKTFREYQDVVVAQYLNRRRNTVARRVGDTFGDVTDFARRQSLFTPGATDDRHFVGVIFARIGDIVTHGGTSSAAPAAANERAPINMRNRRRVNAPADQGQIYRLQGTKGCIEPHFF